MSAALVDDYIDVDEILAGHRRRKFNLYLLITGVFLLFVGTMSGYYNIVHSTNQLDMAKSTVIEFATTTLESERCINNPDDPVCRKAQAAIKNPDLVIGSSNTGLGLTGEIVATARVYNFNDDPVTNIMAIIMSQPLLRVQTN